MLRCSPRDIRDSAALTLIGSFASIYHPVGIPMLGQQAANPGEVLIDERKRIRYPSLASTLVSNRLRRQTLARMRVLYEAEAIRIANGTIYGLGGAIWSKDPERALRVGRRSRPWPAPAPFSPYRRRPPPASPAPR